MKISTIDRLRALPDLFDQGQAIRMLRLDANTLHVYLDRWKKRGLISAAGPRARLYYNLLSNPMGPEYLCEKALLRLYPTAVARGYTVLHDFGWMTQIPNKKEVVVLARLSYIRVDGFDIQGRSARWFGTFVDNLWRSRNCMDSLSSLTPEAALVDLCMTGKCPDRDDLDIPEQSYPTLKALFEKTGVAMPEWLRTEMMLPEQLMPMPTMG